MRSDVTINFSPTSSLVAYPYRRFAFAACPPHAQLRLAACLAPFVETEQNPTWERAIRVLLLLNICMYTRTTSASSSESLSDSSSKMFLWISSLASTSSSVRCKKKSHACLSFFFDTAAGASLDAPWIKATAFLTTFVDPVFFFFLGLFFWRWRRKKTFLHPKPGYVASRAKGERFFFLSPVVWKEGWTMEGCCFEGTFQLLDYCPDQTTITTQRRKHTTTKK